MVLPQPSCLRSSAQAFGRSVYRRSTSRPTTNLFKQIGRRTYASGHEAKQSSDLPWLIGSVVVTVPAASWLLSQAPQKGDHGHGTHSKEGHEDGQEEASADDSKDTSDEKQGEDSKPESDGESQNGADSDSKDDDSKGDSKAKSTDDAKGGQSQDESKGQGQSDDSDSNSGDAQDTPETSADEEVEDSAGKPGQYNRNPSNKPGENAKADRKSTELKGEKDSKGDYSGADHPYIDDPEKSKKAQGMVATAKIHGTVDPSGGKDA